MKGSEIPHNIDGGRRQAPVGVDQVDLVLVGGRRLVFVAHALRIEILGIVRTAEALGVVLHVRSQDRDHGRLVRGEAGQFGGVRIYILSLDIAIQRHADLVQVRAARHAPRGGQAGLHGRHGEGNQCADHRNNYNDLHKGESAARPTRLPS